MPEQTIKAVIFDCFGVIYPVPANEYYDAHRQAFSGEYKLWLDEINRQIDLGEISSETYHKKMEDEIGIPAEKIKEETRKLTVLRQDMASLVKELKHEYKIGLLSNTGDGELDVLERDGIKDLFEVITASYLVKILKPDPRIYIKCADALGVRPEECLFIDDNFRNVAGAEEVGMRSIRFKSLSQLKTDLGRILNAGVAKS